MTEAGAMATSRGANAAVAGTEAWAVPFVLLFWKSLKGHHPCPIPGEMEPTRGKQSREREDSDRTFRELKPMSFPLLCLTQFELSSCHM